MCHAKATHIFSAAKNISIYAIFNDESFNDMLTNDIVSFEQQGLAGLGGSVGCAVRLETRRSRVQPPPRSATFFRGD